MSATASQAPRPARLIKDRLLDCGIELIAMLPDSRLTELYELISEEPRFKKVLISKEDEGVGICAGAYSGGMRSALVMANAGLLASVYPLATLSMMCRLPVFMVISHRGTVGDKSFFQEFQGVTTRPILDAMGARSVLIDTPEKIDLIPKAYEYCRLYKRSTAVLLTDEVVDPHGFNATRERRFSGAAS